MAISEIFSQRALTRLIVFLTISAAYLYTFPQTNIFYAAVVLLHALAQREAAIAAFTKSGWRD